jgi:hypothetical protein
MSHQVKGKNLLATSWEERNYTDWNFGMYPLEAEQFRRKCVIYQFYRFLVLSIKMYKTASKH